MAGYFFFVLTFLFYISLMFFKPAAGHNDIISGFLVFIFYGIGFISSLLLTNKLVQLGGFDWVSNQSGIRYVIVGLGWISLTMATLIGLDIKEALKPGELNPFFQWLAKYKFTIWLPLLMLVPYFLLLNVSWKASVSPFIYKLPLIIGFALSTIIVFVFLFKGLKKIDPDDRSKISYERAVEIINLSSDPEIWKFASRNMDARVRQYAIEKLKENKNWEHDMIQELNGNNRYFGVYSYLDGNAADHPELFIEAIKNNISEIAIRIGLILEQSNNSDEYFLQYAYDVERLCRVLEGHFKNSSAVFYPNMLELQKSLDKETIKPYEEIRNKYRMSVKRWLEENKN